FIFIITDDFLIIDRAIKHISVPPATVKVQNSAELEPFMKESDFIRKYLEYEAPDSDFICLENNVRIW
ncbi:429_t:CDS:2, partial [Racocetra persica]